MKKNNHGFKGAMRRMLILSLALSILLPAGIVMIVLGATNEIWPVMIVGIVFTVAGFYGSPVSWTTFGTLASHKGVYGLITEDGVLDAEVIAATLGEKRKNVDRKLNYLLTHRYLTGYVLGADGRLVRTEAEKPKRLIKCPNCGASLVEKDGDMICPYCGGRFGN